MKNNCPSKSPARGRLVRLKLLQGDPLQEPCKKKTTRVLLKRRKEILCPRNSIKQYLENGYYHLYNRGVEKRNIFLDQQDYSVYLSYLKQYLCPKNNEELIKKISDHNLSYQERDKFIKLLNMNNFFGEISLLAYSLMENHFHFLVKQRAIDSIDKFMNSLGTRYTMYFNKKYKRVGRLYQDVYKAVSIESDEQLLHLSRYIHRQALALQGDPLQDLREVHPSSYGEYLGLRNTEWVLSNEVLSFFSKNIPSLTYESFVSQEESLLNIDKIVIEID